MLVLRGSPGARGLTIDTAAEPGDNPVIDEWGKSDVRFLSTIFWIVFFGNHFQFVLYTMSQKILKNPDQETREI